MQLTMALSSSFLGLRALEPAVAVEVAGAAEVEGTPEIGSAPAGVSVETSLNAMEKLLHH
jgi:hypothetical protein